MIGTIDIDVNAARPNMALPPVYSFVGSPSSVRLRNVPRKVGAWNITAVTISAAYPDNAVRSAACVLTGGVWVGTITGSASAGISANGFTVTASGTDENGDAVTGYVLGKGDVVVMNADSTITVGDTTYYAHILDAVPTTPHKGDMTVVDGVWKLYDGSSWVALGGSSTVAWDAVTGKPTTFPAIVDDTLSTRGTAADAATVGEKLSEKVGIDADGNVEISGEMTVGGILRVDGGGEIDVMQDGNKVSIMSSGAIVLNDSTRIEFPTQEGTFALTTDPAPGLTDEGQTALFASAASNANFVAAVESVFENGETEAF